MSSQILHSKLTDIESSSVVISPSMMASGDTFDITKDIQSIDACNAE